jgi:chromosome segregation ATPase
VSEESEEMEKRRVLRYELLKGSLIPSEQGRFVEYAAYDRERAALLERAERAERDCDRLREKRDWYKAQVEQMQSPDESCLEEREAGNGGCGACATCCEEQRARAENAEFERDEVREALRDTHSLIEAWWAVTDPEETPARIVEWVDRILGLTTGSCRRRPT